MAKETYECRSGFARGRGAEIKTQRGLERVFGAGKLYIVDPKDVADYVAVGWLVPAGNDEIEAATSNPGVKRNVHKASAAAGATRAENARDVNAEKAVAAAKADAYAEGYAAAQKAYRQGKTAEAPLTASQEAELAEAPSDPEPEKPAAKKKAKK